MGKRVTPDMSPVEMELGLEYVNQLLGVDLSMVEVRKLLEQMRYSIKSDGNTIRVSVPAYRTDVLHPIDLVEDVAIAYKYDRFKPELPRSHTPYGSLDELEAYSDSVRELMLGLGFQEVMTLVMSNKRDLFERMQLRGETVVETLNPVSVDHGVARNWLLPSLMVVLEKNRSREYPQKIFEVGDCVSEQGVDDRKLAGVLAYSKANYSEVKGMVTGLLESLSVDYSLEDFRHGSFIGGRCSSIKMRDALAGFYGEIHPQVLSNFGLEVPAAGFELNIGLLRK